MEARSSRPLKYMNALAFNRTFPVFDEDDGVLWRGLVGIDLETKAGRYALVLKGVDLDGKSVTARKIVRVMGKRFPRRILSVDEKFVTPPADALSRIRVEGQRVNRIFSTVTPEKIWGGSFQVPVPGAVISEFGKRSFYNKKPRSPHSGADFRGEIGTPIQAPGSGRVALAADLYFSGNTIILDHGFGLYSYLGHMSEISAKEGELVDRGDVVGKVGATGRVTGPHLHWTVRIGGARVDPLSLVHILENSKNY